MVFTIGLLIAVGVLLVTLLLPGEYTLSPAAAILDAVKSRLGNFLVRGDRERLYAVLGKSPKETLKVGLIAGGGLALVTVLALLKYTGPLALFPAALAFLAGVLLADLVFRNEYRRWQDDLVDGIPTLVTFMPSFLETGAVAPREAMFLTVPFLPEPLRTELHRVVDRAARTGRVKEALSELAERAQHPVMDAISFRLSAAWDARVTPDVFADLSDQIRDMAELAAARATAAKGGLLALVCVIGLLGAGLIFGYPGLQYLMSQMGGVFGQ